MYQLRNRNIIGWHHLLNDGLYRKRLIKNGIEASELNSELYFGHYYFSFQDPDENVVFVYTSHEIKYMLANNA